ncbi:hypothetical protein DL96DRAFT_1465889, partial [Flagelloscypha sp. PMI_526]
MHLTRATEEDPENPRQQITPSQPMVMIDSTEVKNKLTITLLGVTLDENLNWKAQEAKALAKAEAWTLQFKRLARVTKGISAKFMRRIYISVLLPKLTYAVDVWYTP